ncbi:GIY-YIG nuclease family protein [Sphingopyxis sp. NJF-3]
MGYIYALRDPRTCEVRYIGFSTDPDARLRAHIQKARSGHTTHHCARWIMKLIREGSSPECVILHELGDDESWQDCERRWIEEYRARGARLTNMTKGGEGFVGLSDEAIARRVATRRETIADPIKGKRFRESVAAAQGTPEQRARKSRLMKEKFADPEYRDAFKAALATPEARRARSEATKRRMADPEGHAEHCAAMKRYAETDEGKAALQKLAEISHTPSVNAKRAASVRKAYQNPELRRQASEVNREIGARPDVKRRKSKASREMWADPERREAIMAALTAPETKEKQSSAKIKSWSDPATRRRIVEARWTPERRREQAERIRKRNADRSKKE